MSLDSILNIAAPIVIFVGLGLFIYSKAKKPIDAFFAKIKEWIQQIQENQYEKEDESDPEYNIAYRGAEY